MAVSDLNIRIGVLYRDFDRGLKQVETRLGQTAEKFGQLGNAMSASISLPVAAIGGAAVTAAADFESLRLAINTTMKDAGYTTEQAAAELKALQKISLAPGIDMEQAVKGSIRLQAVGFSAERARGVLVELANALASSGGSAQQLDGVTRQFAQMAAKGRLMQEDLTIILENMPSLAKVLMEAFGTTNAEAIRNMGVSADEFITKVTEGLSKTERVQGGIANAITNAQNALKMFFVTIGDGINEAYNLAEVGDNISDVLGRVAQAFKNLDPETKKSIINFALYAAAIGPVFKGLQLLYSAAQTAVTGVRLFADYAKSLSSAALGAYSAISKMSIAMKFTVAGAVVAGVIALAYAFGQMRDNVQSAFHVTNKLNEVQKKATEYSSEQIGKIDALVATVKNETYSQEQRATAIKELQSLYPAYFANLSTENINISELSSGYERLKDSIKKAALARAAEEGLTEISKKSISLQEERNKQIEYYNKYLSQSAEAQLLNNSITQAGRDEVIKGLADKRKEFAQTLSMLDKQIAGQKAEFDALLDVRVANTELQSSNTAVAKTTEQATKATGGNTKALKEQKDAADQYLESVRKTAEAEAKRKQVLDALGLSQLDTLPMPGQLKTVNTESGPQLTGVISSGTEGADELLNLIDVTSMKIQDSFVPSLSTAELAVNSLRSSFALMAEDFKNGGEASAQVTDAVLGSILQMTNEGSVNMKAFGQSALASALKVAKAYAVQGIFAAVSKALQTVPFPLNLAAAGIAAGAAGALLNGLTAKIQPPALAKGGLAYGKTYAMVGDNPAASVNPEVIAPLDKLRSIIGGGSNVTVSGIIRGSDIYLINQKAAEQAGRRR